MTSLKEEATAYVPKRTKNIAELEVVSVVQDIKKEVRKNTENEEYSISFIVIDGEEYRVPNSVLEQLQTMLKEKPDMEQFKVSKKGENLNTVYTVIPM